MKKLSTMLALGLTLAMTFGMTAFAAESPSTGNVNTGTETVTTPTTDVSKVASDSEATVSNTVSNVSVDEVKESDLSASEKASYSAASTSYYKAVTKAPSFTTETKLPEGVTAELKATQLDVAKTATAVKAASKLTEELGLDLADGKSATDAIQAAFDLNLTVNGADKSAVIGKDGVKVVLPVTVTPKEGKQYIVLHQVSEGKWETVPADIKADGTVVATFKTLSPVVIVEVQAKAGEEEDDNDDTVVTVTPSVTATGKAASPKTAETASAAGVIALAAIAGAVAASRKIRYNN